MATSQEVGADDHKVEKLLETKRPMSPKGGMQSPPMSPKGAKQSAPMSPKGAKQSATSLKGATKKQKKQAASDRAKAVRKEMEEKERRAEDEEPDISLFADELAQYEKDVQRFPNIKKVGEDKDMKTLDLTEQFIGECGAHLLGLALCKPQITRKMQYINLSGNYIDSRGVLKLMLAIEQFCTLDRLNLSWNGIGDQAALRLATSLKKMKGTLYYLDLAHNRISNWGAEELANAIRARTEEADMADLDHLHFKGIDLRSNAIGPAGQAKLRKACGKQVKLNVNGNMSKSAIHPESMVGKMLKDAEMWSTDIAPKLGSAEYCANLVRPSSSASSPVFSWNKISRATTSMSRATTPGLRARPTSPLPAWSVTRSVPASEKAESTSTSAKNTRPGSAKKEEGTKKGIGNIAKASLKLITGLPNSAKKDGARSKRKDAGEEDQESASEQKASLQSEESVDQVTPIVMSLHNDDWNPQTKLRNALSDANLVGLGSGKRKPPLNLTVILASAKIRTDLSESFLLGKVPPPVRQSPAGANTPGQILHRPASQGTISQRPPSRGQLADFRVSESFHW